MQKLGNRKKKVAFLAGIISPYKIPCWNEVAKNELFDFEVYFCAAITKDRSWKVYYDEIKFKYKKLKGIHPIFGGFTVHINWILPIIRNKYDLVVIEGYYQPTFLLTWLISKLLNSKVAFLIESSHLDKRTGNCTIEALKRFIITHSDALMVAGQASLNYMKSFGVKPSNIFHIPYTADYNFFSDKYRSLKSEEITIKTTKNTKLKEDGNLIFLYVGRLWEGKGIFYLLRAFKKLQMERNNICLILVGDGPDEHKYRKMTKEESIQNVYFEGFKQKEELPEYYALADIFILPSLTEPWGLVVNEAMIFNLPVICTNKVGAAYDLIENGKNGLIVDAANADSLYKAMKILAESSELRGEMGKISAEIIKRYTPQTWADGFINGAKSVLRVL